MKKKLILSILMISMALEAEYFVELWIYDELPQLSISYAVIAYLAFLAQTFVQLLLIFSINVYIVSILEEKYPWGEYFILRSVFEFTLTTIVAIAITAPVVLYIDHGFLTPLFQFPSDGRVITLYYNLLYISVINALFIVTYEVVFLFGERNRIKLAWEQSKNKAIIAQFESLKNQVNPHFLLNSMHTMLNLIQEDQSKAKKFCEEFINLYRNVLTLDSETVISIHEEMSFTKSYISLYKIQFGNYLDVEVEMDENMDGCIPPFSLQLLIENAFKHNEISREKPLKVKISESDGYLQVVNNLNPKTIQSSSTKVGLSNLKERYRLLGTKEVIIESGENHFIVSIPIL
ncbi:histidine kinase [Ekhidna sp.]|uniref:sensor histidine kinase n=1 Tax=Ekhidna sp. TaxID=2608089 RepID=UPI003299EEA5